MKFKVQSSKFKVLGKVFGLLSSKAFLIWIVGGWITYYVLSAVWMKEAFATFVSGLARNPFLQIPFVLFLASGYSNFIRASKEVLKKGKRQFFMWALLPAGALLFFTGFFVSLATRQFDWLVAGQEHIVKPRWSSDSYKIAALDPGVKERILDIDIDSGLGIFKYEPKMTLLDRNSRSYEVGAFPPTRIGDTYHHILNFGMMPGVRLFEGAVIKDEGYIPLRILGPGSSDSFEIPPYPYKFLLSLEPERVFQKGNLKASEYNLRDPLYRVRVLKGGSVVAETVSKERINFDNLTLFFLEPAFWVQLEVVRDYGVPVILAGLFLIVIGLPLSLLRLLLIIPGREAQGKDI